MLIQNWSPAVRRLMYGTAPALVAIAAMSPSAKAAFHLWAVNEIYSNSSGSVQFIELTDHVLAARTSSAPRTCRCLHPTARRTTCSPSPTSRCPAAHWVTHLPISAPQALQAGGRPGPGLHRPGQLPLHRGRFHQLLRAQQQRLCRPCRWMAFTRANVRLNGPVTVNSPKNYAGQTSPIPAPASLGLAAAGGCSLPSDAVALPDIPAPASNQVDRAPAHAMMQRLGFFLARKRTPKMRRYVSAATLCLIGVLCALPGCAGESAGSGAQASSHTESSPAQPLPLDLDGHPFDIGKKQPSPITVVIFTRTDCPVSNRYAPEVRHLYETYHPRGVDFFLVYVATPTKTQPPSASTCAEQLPLQGSAPRPRPCPGGPLPCHDHSRGRRARSPSAGGVPGTHQQSLRRSGQTAGCRNDARTCRRHRCYTRRQARRHTPGKCRGVYDC